MILGWLAAGALACGGMFGPMDATVFSAAQQAIFEPGADEVAVEYLVDTGGELTNWGWVVPIPGAFVAMEEGDSDRFDDLAWQTAVEPTFHSDPEPRGCGPASKGGGDNATRSGTDITIIDAGTAGVFDYVALQATSSGALLTWLDDHGWDVDESAPSIDAYVAEGGWQFVAITLNTDVAPGPGGVVRTAARIRYEGGRLVFPSRMSRYSRAPEQRTTIWVVGDQRATASGWAVEPFPEFRGLYRDFDYVEILAEASVDEPTALEVWADQLDGDFVTRFDLVAASELHDDDLDFALVGGQLAFHPRVDLYESREGLEGDERDCSTTGGVVPWIWLVAAVATRRRREV